MTDPTPLSPAARAVLEAAIPYSYEAEERVALVAAFALRAAANQLTSTKAMLQILAIADELDAMTEPS